mmetsp:Transcript_1581/g.1956  ORF Transcript_1581/g.1956 Transcript_1581/m.1956 type:complete len:131 (-) Transcript_1581:132-524(-)|eukprot:jgi/Bigna1/88912/estExt_fgenesh1_pg.C_400064
MKSSANPKTSFSAQMKALLQRKQQIEEDLKSTERQLFELEEAYIADTSHYGNVVKGWEGYNAAKPKQGQNVRRAKIVEKDRIFSTSSTTAPKVKEEDGQDEIQDRPMRRRERTSTRNKNYSYSDDDDYEP